MRVQKLLYVVYYLLVNQIIVIEEMYCQQVVGQVGVGVEVEWCQCVVYFVEQGIGSWIVQ